jgi:hypothetical protein
MSVDQLLVEIEKFIVFSAGSQPESGALVPLAAMAVAAWVGTAVSRQMIRLAVVLAQAAMAAVAAVASLSTVVVACLVVAFLALPG